jgi:uncharacterized DUF497 family protein
MMVFPRLWGASSFRAERPEGEARNTNSINSKQILVFDNFGYYNYAICMKYIQFEWDPSKNETNIKKHQISFDEAKTAFYDPNARLINDPEHSNTEDRFILLGLSKQLNLLIVCHCYKSQDEFIRIISARKATKIESTQYGGQI